MTLGWLVLLRIGLHRFDLPPVLMVAAVLATVAVCLRQESVLARLLAAKTTEPSANARPGNVVVPATWANAAVAP